MNGAKRQSLRERITKEMVADDEDALERNFDVATKLVRITGAGKVEVIDKAKLTNAEKIALYLVGKKYAAEGGLAVDDCASNRELADELGLPEGSVNSGVKRLRDEGQIVSENRGRQSVHRLKANRIEPVLRNVQNKLYGGRGDQERS